MKASSHVCVKGSVARRGRSDPAIPRRASGIPIHVGDEGEQAVEVARFGRQDGGEFVLIVLNGPSSNRVDPLGARHVAASAEAQGATVEMCEERLVGRDGLLSNLRSRRRPPAAVLISAGPGTADLKDFAQSACDIGHRQVPVILGGVGAARLNLSDLRVGNAIVVVVRGMGEVATATITTMLKTGGRLDPHRLDTIPNLTYRIDGEVAHTRESRTICSPLDVVPSATGLAASVKRGSTISATTSVGCRWRCTFCTGPESQRVRGWRPRGPVTPEGHLLFLVLWLRRIVAAGGRGLIVNIIDDAGVSNVEHLLAVVRSFEFINAETGAGLRLRLSCRADSLVNRADTRVERKHRARVWRRAVDAGLTSVFIGAESGAATQLRRYRKGLTPAENRRAIDTVRALGLSLETGFLPIDPQMPEATWRDELRETVRLAQRARVESTCPTWLSSIRVYADSPLYRQLEEKGLLGAEIGDSGEFLYDYESEEVKDFVLSLGPAICCEGNPLRTVKRHAKTSERYANGAGRPVVKAVEALIERELCFVTDLLDATTPSAIAAAQRRFRNYALASLRAAKSAAAAADAIDELTTDLDAAIRVMTAWRVGEAGQVRRVAIAGSRTSRRVG